MRYHHDIFGGEKRDEQQRSDTEADPRTQSRQHDHEMKRHQRERSEGGVQTPGRLDKEVFVEDAGNRVCQRQYRGHGRVDRGDHAVANADCGGAYQHDLILVLAGGNLAFQHIIKRVHGKCRLAGAVITVEKSIHQ